MENKNIKTCKFCNNPTIKIKYLNKKGLIRCFNRRQKPGGGVGKLTEKFN